MADWITQTVLLSDAISGIISRRGVKTCEDFSSSIEIVGIWYGYLDSSELTGCCDGYLNALRVSLVEACSSLAAGLIRPALFSMRGQIDAILIWLYFKDHPVEAQRVENYGDGYMLKSEIIDYLDKNIMLFKKRYEILKHSKVRSEAEPYKILSAHIHYQSLYTVPDLTSLRSIVSGDQKICEAIALQKQVSEYISDVLFSVFAVKWAALPMPIMDSVKARVSPDKLAIMCGT